jgi:hypothetical protein
MTLFRCAALVMLSTSLAGCLVARVPLMIEAHQAEQRFPAKGEIDSAQPRTLISGGLQRRYWVQVPAAAKASTSTGMMAGAAPSQAMRRRQPMTWPFFGR